MRKLTLAGILLLAVVAASPGAAQQQSYTLEEYNAYTAASRETNVAQRIKLLDAFVEKWPESTMLKPYIHPLYVQSCTEAYQAKNYAATREAADHFLALANTDAPMRFQSIYWRTVAFHADLDEKSPNLAQAAGRANQLAKEALQILPTIQKPENVSQADWDKQLQGPKILMNFTIGLTAQLAKNYSEAADAYRTALALNPNEAPTSYRLGLVNLQMEPPRYMDGFWALARAIALKMPGEAQVRSYLRTQVLRYQQTQCEPELDRQVNEIIALAGQSATRPADYRVPSAEDLTRARENAGAFLEDLKAGGENAKLVWLSVCGLEFPDVGVKVIDVADNGEGTVLKVFRAQMTPDLDQDTFNKIMEEATEPNMEVRVTEQPEASRIEKDSFVRFTGTLSGYQPEPFLLSWTKAKVNLEDIPAEGAQPGKGKRPTKRPGR